MSLYDDEVTDNQPQPDEEDPRKALLQQLVLGAIQRRGGPPPILSAGRINPSISSDDPRAPMSEAAPVEEASNRRPPIVGRPQVASPGQSAVGAAISGVAKVGSPGVSDQNDQLREQQRNLILSRTNPALREEQRLQSSPAGWRQIHNPFLRTVAGIGDTALNMMASRGPLAAALGQSLPGTTLHHNALLNNATQAADQGLAQEKVEADTAKDIAAASPKPEQAEWEQAKGPDDKPLFRNGMPIMRDKKSNKFAVFTPQGAVPFDANQQGGQGTTDTKPFFDPAMQKAPTAEEDKQERRALERKLADGSIKDDERKTLATYQREDKLSGVDAAIRAAVGTPPVSANYKLGEKDPQYKTDAQAWSDQVVAKEAKIKQTVQLPARPPRQMMAVPNGDGTFRTVELTPGMQIPKGARTLSQEGDALKPSAAEQNRADLAKNLNENLDQLEQIVKNRPDLFGKVSGRLTGLKEAIGSDDPDVAALKGIEDRLGMVAQSSHGMRSAQHVEEAAKSITNNYKNGQAAMLRVIADARKSSKTFADDVDIKEGRTPSSGGATHIYNPKTGTAEPVGQQ